jgi:ParB family chromosome partitioning protein
MVDNKRLGFSQGIDISFLSDEAQQWIEDAIVEKDCNVSLVQSAKLKEYGKNGELTPAMVRLILTEEKSRERKFTIKSDKINRYFSEGYSNEDIEKVIISLLDKWKEEGEE